MNDQHSPKSIICIVKVWKKTER